MCKAQLGWIKDKEKKQHVFQKGDQVWLDRCNIKMYHPTAKLAPKCHGPFPIQWVLSPIDYVTRRRLVAWLDLSLLFLA